MTPTEPPAPTGPTPAEPGYRQSPRRDRLAQAALSVFDSKGICEATFADVVAKADLARSTAQREFTNKSELIHYLHLKTLDLVFGSIARRVRDRSADRYGAVVRAGVLGLLEGIRLSPWTAEYLVRHRGQATGYLLNPEPDGLIAHLAAYTAECAAGVGRSGVQDEAHDFVTRVLARTTKHLREHGRWPSDDPWPDWVDEEVALFLEQTGLGTATFRPGPLPVPTAGGATGSTHDVVAASLAVPPPRA